MTLPKSLVGLKKFSPLVSEQGKILLLGAAGQIGEHIFPILEMLYPGKIIATARTANPAKKIRALDITDTQEVINLIRDETVEVVINMAAFLSAKSEENPDRAREINFYAVKRLIEGTKELGVKQIFTPSSIAVYGADAEKHATMQTITKPSGMYGKAKVELEHFMREWNENGEGAFATSLRLGGVLTCKIPPSEGTAMEFDKMLVAAAAKKCGKSCDALKTYYDSNGAYHPHIPEDTKMPFILVDDAAREIVRYLHKVTRTDPNATRHHLAAFTLEMKEFAKKLEAKSNNQINFIFDDKSTTGPKATFAKEWPHSIDITESILWGFDTSACATADKAIHTCFDRVTKALKGYNRARTR